jgi:hypothetical protein
MRSLHEGPILHPTVRDLPAMRRTDAVRHRVDADVTATGFTMFARCESCGATVRDWRKHLADRIRTAEPNRVRLRYDGACEMCGGSDVTLEAEPRR